MKNVEVIFEKEQLSSFNSMSEIVFNFMTILAQEESRSISENIIWSLDSLASKGIRKLGNNRVFGYDEINGVLTPNENSKIVNIIFDDYSNGYSIKYILNKLCEMRNTKLRSNKSMKYNDIKRILNNVIYKGDRIIQKNPHRNYITKKIDSTSSFTQYYVVDAHEAIVSNEIWNKCQERLNNTR